jgi:hypothetical protein
VGGGGIVSWLYLAIAAPVAAMLVARADLAGGRWSPGELVEVAGVGLGCSETGAYEGGRGAVTGDPIYRNAFAYRVDGAERRGASYAPGTCVPRGQAVVVQVLRARPDQARIAGMRRKEGSPWLALAGLFPLAGLIPALLQLATGRRRLALLSRGRLARATLIGRRPLRLQVNEARLTELRYAFLTAAGARSEAVVRTLSPPALEAGGQEALLYDPERPARAEPWSVLAGHGLLGPGGQLAGPGPVRVGFTLLWPAAAVLGPALVLLGR